MSVPDRLLWIQVGSTEEDCLKELQDLYWKTLEFELADTLLSLHWILKTRESSPQSELNPVDIPDRVPVRLGPAMWAWNPLNLPLEEIIGVCVPEAMEQTREQQDEPDEYLLARYMLNGLGMLDIDEVVEYRKPFLPSQNGPARFYAEKAEDGIIQISMMQCDACNNPLRGMAWTCRAGCQSVASGPGIISGPYMVCMLCYHHGKHQRQHLVRWPHSYAISPALQKELDPTQFWHVRREIQRQQDAIDAEQDQKEQGFVKSTMAHNLGPISRSFFPLGNVHSYLMFGPLIFEIGQDDSRGGVRVSCRRPPNLGKNWGAQRKEDTFAISPDRKIFKTQTRIRDRTLQASIKQIVGGMFSGYYSHYQPFEKLVVKMTASGAKRWQEHPLRSREASHKSLLKLARHLINPLKFIIEDHVKTYLRAFTHVMFNRNTNLHWDKYTNNCQNFCDAILHQTAFSTLFPPREQLYCLPSAKGGLLDFVLSFRTQPQLGDILEQSKISCGPLATFFKQIHNPSNVIHSQEGTIEQVTQGNPLPCAKLMGWNCQSEDCGPADHIWTNPAEFSSILQLHLLLDRSHYVEENQREDADPVPMDDIGWIRNRIAVLQALDLFTSSAAGVARTFQARLVADESLEWKPPVPYCIPQDYPFVCQGDSVMMTSQDPVPSRSFFGSWFGNSNEDKPDIELPGQSERGFKIKIFQPGLAESE